MLSPVLCSELSALEPEYTEADVISAVEFSQSGEFLATGDKGGRVVIFQREPLGEYNVYSTFQSHEPEFDYLKSLEIEEKINKIRWLPQLNSAHFLLTTNDKTIKLWKVSERDKRPEGYNLKDEEGRMKDISKITSLQVPVLRPMDLLVEASLRRVFANAHAYHINSISINSDCETYLSADDLRINLWNLDITDRSFNIVDLKPENMEELSEVITVAEFHPHHCHLMAFSSSTGTTRLCDMRSRALCDQHAKLFEEAVDPANRSFFSEIISSVSDVKFSHSGRYLLTRDYLSAKVWDLNMENKPVETYQVHDYLRSKLCTLYESDCIFDKFECAWNGTDSVIMTGAYNNFFRMFDRASRRDVTLEASREVCKRRAVLRPRRVCVGRKKRESDVSVDSLDFRKKILHTAWHPTDNIIAIAASNNLYIFQDRHSHHGHHAGHRLEQDRPPQLQDAPPQ
ncbi:serine/threonine-protein phosphatase 2A 55 kDa regulatory subunit B beta isoform [Colossoma macropomum]|uniref:serine/threonine-protein phosphatase 2A 55 kDa regulatory subunit B beta isoform n=1 Tax=Colossoma macropomum TaxID=42526 RepID=UPI001863CC67|nr:serine/threonine-protein phosphatase 2A 55 kDa regulatory subunit B beta isoform [Colossoma macropomum]XP_036424739.1 serine/threonine-protein phosphatase 2A 55 kDa regulatory subunit B beta isoform [Colossoma macropomum]